MGSQFLQQNDSREAKIAEQSDELHPHQDRASPVCQTFLPHAWQLGFIPSRAHHHVDFGQRPHQPKVAPVCSPPGFGAAQAVMLLLHPLDLLARGLHFLSAVYLFSNPNIQEFSCSFNLQEGKFRTQ